MRGRFGDGLDVQRLWREVRAAASLNHPNICQIYEIEEHGDELILAMELSRTVRSFLRVSAKIPGGELERPPG